MRGFISGLGKVSETESAFDRVQYLQVSADQAGQRIDNFLLSRLKGVPKSRVYRLLRKGEVRVNKGRIRPEYRLIEDDVVRVPPIRVSKQVTVAPGRALRGILAGSILLETEEFLVINKPFGLAVHGGSGINLGVIESLRAMREPHAYLELAHRLDRDTSGCLLIAKSRRVLKHLQDQMRQRSMDKRYITLVSGRWAKERREVNAPLLKQTVASGERIVRANSEGKPSLTRFKLLKHYANASLLEVKLETGRTHQIRVHCQLVGHPLAGDPKYGNENFNQTLWAIGLKRLFLHAGELTFSAPTTGERVKVEAPLPGELQAFLKRL
ncbi:MAG: 23S rRNA pseudouridine(955/2504/2580) synthase RluC [Gammaproteobacteria bacterium]|nr:23S rRNA pseudouridine(955/2504/2580) synthase RluC [Gammaproteobacteria bacterium]MBQ0840529.1 23S rRNA pseudouridine(955/2504/2580) synthase RluC [Gammaproteobacteria bacterium]